MAVVQQGQNQGFAKLNSRPQGESLWVDAWWRLRRNRMAVLGLIIIIASLLVAAFAPILAPKAYDKQVLADNNSAPRWVTQLFPSMIPRDEGGYVPINESYPIGADGLGRDLLSSVISDTRCSLADTSAAVIARASPAAVSDTTCSCGRPSFFSRS